MKKLMALVLAFVLVCGMVGCCEAAEERVVYLCNMKADGTAEITGVNKTHLTVMDIPAEVNGHKVTSIKSFAFGNCNNVLSVTIAEGIEVIGDDAFANAFDLESVSIPDSLKSVGPHAFRSKKLTEIKVSPDHPVFAVENHALIDKQEMTLVRFAGADVTDTYVVTPGIRKIADAAFEFARVSSVLIPDSVSAIGDLAFTGCERLQSINIPDSVVEMGDNVFEDCRSLTSIQISRLHPVFDCIDLVMVRKADMEMFSASGALQGKYVIPAEIRSIASLTFQGCRYLKELYIPDTVEKIDDYAFSVDTVLRAPKGSVASEVCSAYTWYKFTEMSPEDFAEAVKELADGTESTVSIGSWKSNDGSLVSGDYRYRVNADGSATITSVNEFIEDGTIPAELDGHPVTKIESWAFYTCARLEKVVIPEGVKSLDFDAFVNCSRLESVSIPDSLTSMDRQPFGYCSNLKTFEVSPDHPVYTVEDGMLIDKQEKILIYLLDKEGTGTFTVPQGIRTIADSVFSDCDYSSIVLPDSLVEIGAHAFSNCRKLTEIVIPEHVTSIDNQAFYGSTLLKSITIPDSVERIGAGVFGSNESLTDVILSPDHPNYVMMDRLLVDKRDMCIVAALNSIPDQYEIPEGIKEIGMMGFQGCGDLAKIVLPEGLTKIGNDAFSGCFRLIQVTLPASVNEIGYEAFVYSHGLHIHAPAGSWAQQYAEENGYRFEAVD